ncbi:MAG: hypothetical protein IKB04_04480 [Clostridia bacterium]|nr:hypothetical protein [Clostridia bacterium]
MKCCTFFGHADAPAEIIPELKEIIQYCIKKHAVDTFYVGEQGNFDRYARQIIKEIQQEQSEITYYVVLSYLPKKTADFSTENTIYPEGLEMVPRRFAIDKRNRWMIDHSDFVITYVSRSFGGAAKFKEIAEKKNRVVINIT